jgi:hypothetical protein
MFTPTISADEPITAAIRAEYGDRTHSGRSSSRTKLASVVQLQDRKNSQVMWLCSAHGYGASHIHLVAAKGGQAGEGMIVLANPKFG